MNPVSLASLAKSALFGFSLFFAAFLLMILLTILSFTPLDALAGRLAFFSIPFPSIISWFQELFSPKLALVVVLSLLGLYFLFLGFLWVHLDLVAWKKCFLIFAFHSLQFLVFGLLIPGL